MPTVPQLKTNSLGSEWTNLQPLRGHSNNTWHFRGRGLGGVSKNVTWQFLLVILLEKVDKTCYMGWGGGGLKSAEKVSRIIWMAPYLSTFVFLGRIQVQVLPLLWERHVQGLRHGKVFHYLNGHLMWSR